MPSSEIRQQLNVPVGDTRADQAIRTGRYFDIANAHIKDSFGERFRELSAEKGERFMISLKADRIGNVLLEEVRNSSERRVDLSVADESWAGRSKGQLLPSVRRPLGGDVDDTELTCSGLEVVRQHPYKDDMYDWFELPEQAVDARDQKSLSMIEQYFSALGTEHLRAWTSDIMATDRTMHPIELDDAGILDVEVIGDKATISLDAAIRLLNGMRIYFGRDEYLFDHSYVPLDGVVETHGWDETPHGKAFDHALRVAGIEPERTAASPGDEQLVFNPDSPANKFWQLAHALVMRNTVEVPIIGGRTTDFETKKGMAPKPIHHWNRYDYDVRTLASLKGSAIEASRRDSSHSDDISLAVKLFFEHLDVNNRIDLGKLTKNMLTHLSLGLVLGTRDEGIEENVDEFNDVVERLKCKLDNAGVAQPESGIVIINAR